MNLHLAMYDQSPRAVAIGIPERDLCGDDCCEEAPLVPSVRHNGRAVSSEEIVMTSEVAQSLSSLVWKEPLVLNDRFVSFGKLEEVLHHGYEHAPMDIGCIVQMGSPDMCGLDAATEMARGSWSGVATSSTCVF